MLVASALGVHPKMHVLDLCAAPGGKTTHLAELMDNRGHVSPPATSTPRRGLETVTTLCQRLRVKGVETVLLKEDGEIPNGPFDAAVVDVPCSNTGVLGRRPEVRWRLKPNEFEHLVRLQTRLLIVSRFLVRVKPGACGGVFNACSIEPEENEGARPCGVQGHARYRARSGTPLDSRPTVRWRLLGSRLQKAVVTVERGFASACSRDCHAKRGAARGTN